MVRIDKRDRRAYLLDTNVLIHDPACIGKFQEHDVLIPMTVLEELDQLKKGMTDMARSARQATRGLNGLLNDIPAAEVAGGVPLPVEAGAGRLYFLSGAVGDVPTGLPSGSADNRIIAEAMEAQRARPEVSVIVVSKDVNLRVKCAAVGLPVEDYHNDRVVDDIDTMTSGVYEGGQAEWSDFDADLSSWQAEGRSYYRLRGPVIRGWHPGMLVATGGGPGMEAMVREREGDTALLEVCRDHRSERHAVWGVRASDTRQNFALNLLLHPDIDLVTIAGVAGTGKTFLALAAGLHLIYEARQFERIVITRETVPMGEGIGFLPGTEEEKMAPWMGAFHDNMESLLRTDSGWGNPATKEMLQGRIQMRSPGFMRGRTFNDTLLILDEAQNLSPKQIKGLITRAGRNTKIVCLGNVAQIDTPYLTATTCGLTALAQRFRDWDHAGHVTLTGVERSRLALRAEHVL